MRLSFILIFLAACGGRDRDEPDPQNNVGTGAMSAPLAAAHTVPDRATTDSASAANLTVEAAIAASIIGANGTRLITTGTLIATNTDRRWTPEPTDRLIVELNGRRFELVITALDGNFTSSDAFFSGDHILDATVRSDDGSNVQIRSRRANGARGASVRGTLMIDEIAYQLDLGSDGTVYFENDSTGTEYRDQHRSFGTIDFPSGHVDVDESWDFNLVSTTGSQRATVTSAVRTIASRMQADGHRYDWQGVRLQKAFRDGHPNEVDTFWGANGVVLKDGAPFGQYHLEANLVTREAGVLKFQLLLPNETIDLETWQAY